MNKIVKADAAALIAASNIFTVAFQPIKSLEGFTCAFTLQAYPKSLLEKCDNSLRLKVKDGPFMSILILNWWKNQSDDDVVISTFQIVVDQIDEHANAQGTSVPYKYMKYAYGFQDPIQSYGKGVPRNLQEVSGKYDPEGIFQNGVPGGFKIL